MHTWLLNRRVALAAGVAAGLPLIISTVRGVNEGWVAFGDRAVIAARAMDVLSGHPPLVGQFTQWSQILGRAIFSPGPMLYWLVAIPARFLPQAGLTIWIAAVNLLAILGIVLLARQRGGQRLMLGTALAVTLVSRSLPSESLHDIWNPYAALMPFLLLCFTAWSVACGEYRLLPLTVVLFTFVVQTHLAFLAPGLGLLVVALAGLAIHLHRQRSSGLVSDRGSVRRWCAASAGIFAVAWIAPLVNELFRGGNMSLIVRAVLHNGPKFGLAAGWHTVARAFGVIPWWLGQPVGNIARFFDVAGAPSWFAQATCVLLLVALLGLLAVVLRQRRQDLAALLVIALLLVVVLGADTASTPTSHGLALNVSYTLWWASLAGMFIWLALAWSAAVLIGGWLVAHPNAGPRRVRPLISLRTQWMLPTALAATAAVGLAIGLSQSADIDSGAYRPFGMVANRLAAVLPSPGTVLVTPDPTLRGTALQHVVVTALPSVVYALKRQGATVLLPSDYVATLGSQYAAGLRSYDHRLMIDYGQQRVTAGRLIARVTVRPPTVPNGTYSTYSIYLLSRTQGS